MAKDNIREVLIMAGRDLVRQNGAAYLTARKLAEASGYSVGTIYNQFSNMDSFIMAENMLTLDELQTYLGRLVPDSSAYKNLNRYLDGFVNFVMTNRNFWFLFYSFHLSSGVKRQPTAYVRKLVSLTDIWKPSFDEVFRHIGVRERRLAMQVLWLSLFSMSSFLTTDALDNFSHLNKKTVCQLLLNTYLAGLRGLKGA